MGISLTTLSESQAHGYNVGIKLYIFCIVSIPQLQFIDVFVTKYTFWRLKLQANPKEIADELCIIIITGIVSIISSMRLKTCKVSYCRLAVDPVKRT